MKEQNQPKSKASGFSRLFAAHTISNLGDGVVSVAYPWLASTLTSSPLWIAAIGISSRSAWLVFPIIGGGIVDRLDRKRLLVRVLLVQFGITAVIGAVLFSYERKGAAQPIDSELWLILLAMGGVMLSVAEVLRDVGSQAILPDLVSSDALDSANGRLSAAEFVGNELVGVVLGGALLTGALWIPFGFDAVTFLLAAAAISLISDGRVSTARQPASFLADLRVGMRFLRGSELLRRIAAALGVSNFLMAYSFATFVLYSRELLQVGATGFALLGTGGAVSGAAAGLIANRFIRAIGRGRIVVAYAAAAGLSLLIIGLVPHPVVAWVLYAVLMFWATLWSIVARTARQRTSPRELMGRLAGIHRAVAWGSAPLGILLGGSTVALVGSVMPREVALKSPFVIAGASFLLFGFWMRRRVVPSMTGAGTDEEGE